MLFGLGQPSLVWVSKISPKILNFFPLSQKNLIRLGQKVVGLLFTAGRKFARVVSGPLSTFYLAFWNPLHFGEFGLIFKTSKIITYLQGKIRLFIFFIKLLRKPFTFKANPKTLTKLSKLLIQLLLNDHSGLDNNYSCLLKYFVNKKLRTTIIIVYI